MADTLRQLRRARGLTQAALAERAGVHRTTIGQIERGTWLPHHSTARRIAAALGVRLAAIAKLANGDADDATTGPAAAAPE